MGGFMFIISTLRWMRIWWRRHFCIFVFLYFIYFVFLYFITKVDENLVEEAGEAIIFLHWEEEDIVPPVQDLPG